MTFTQLRAGKLHGRANAAENDGCISVNNPIWRANANFLAQCPDSAHLQQKHTGRTAKKRRNVKLEVRSEPSQQKMRRISERQGSYKRSTNNSHKKFICVAKRLLLRLLEDGEREEFENGFEEFKNSRTYYFIVLAHAKLLLPPERLDSFRRQFVALMGNKIAFYRKEVDRTDNRNFINFRCDEIADIEFALTALDLYFEERVEQAIETIYKRDRAEVLKKQQFELAVQAVREVEAKLRNASHPHNHLQNVIILQHNVLPASHPNQEEKSTLGNQMEGQRFEQADSPHFALGIHPASSFIRAEQPQQERDKKSMPLLFLEQSYPYLQYFYEIMFPYEAQIGGFMVNPIDYLCAWNFPQGPMPGIDPHDQNPAQDLQIGRKLSERGKKGSLFVGKTAVDEQDAGMEGL